MTEADDYRLDRARVRRHFNASAASYDTVAVLQREVADRLLERLEPLLIRPRRVLDLGAGTGYASRELLRRYRKAEVYAVDASAQMLRRARYRPPWRRKPHCACADLHALPFPDDSFELVFSNVALQWAEDLGKALAEMQRVTAPEGAVMFSTFGPETLHELRTAWAEVDGYPHVHRFVDKHDIGDRMLEAGLVDPVVDGELFTLTYEQPREVMRDLKALGAANAAAGRARGLVSPHRLARVEAAYSLAFRQPGGRVPATYEVVYGHAWGREGRPQQVDETGAVHIDAAQIRRRR
ncbi:malonyl-ACP O-methyltransferase BioC [Halorhodospira neutriphila]|uniref:Malonyl-[acyl-carrier protein] O-methyltransferase n=1 Tax=Halorhodospira neutriphila TaxID=168379 RepID=A0ABS1E9G2_9GAMM|nr:malonyl-[acyl-carrier protein] O-methyltransferase BioC [Halorhodospira neutriphila]